MAGCDPSAMITMIIYIPSILYIFYMYISQHLPTGGNCFQECPNRMIQTENFFYLGKSYTTYLFLPFIPFLLALY